VRTGGRTETYAYEMFEHRVMLPAVLALQAKGACQRAAPFASPKMTKLAHDATAVAMTSPESRIPAEGRLGFVSVTCADEVILYWNELFLGLRQLDEVMASVSRCSIMTSLAAGHPRQSRCVARIHTRAHHMQRRTLCSEKSSHLAAADRQHADAAVAQRKGQALVRKVDRRRQHRRCRGRRAGVADVFDAPAGFRPKMYVELSFQELLLLQ